MNNFIFRFGLVAAALTNSAAFVPSSPTGKRGSTVGTQIFAEPEIQFVRGVAEKVVPKVRLTRARDGSSASQGDVTGMFLIDEEGELKTTDVNAKFANGKPQTIESTYVMKSPEEWDRFMRFMERFVPPFLPRFW